MLSDLRKQVESIAEELAEFIIEHLKTMKNAKRGSAFAMNEVSEGIRMLDRVLTTLERLDRLQHNNGASGQGKKEYKSMRAVLEPTGINVDDIIRQMHKVLEEPKT